MKNPLMQQYRSFLKDTIRKHIDFSKTDQNRGIDPPPIEKPFDDDAVIIELANAYSPKGIPGINLSDAIKNRKSRRAFLNQPVTLEELSFLLWATQGIRHKIDCGHAYRTVPSAGCRHALETYLCVLNVESWNKACIATCRWSTSSFLNLPRIILKGRLWKLFTVSHIRERLL